MNGNEFLDKLEHLDPSLVAQAAEPPRAKARRRGPDWSVWAAVAACLGVLCLPLAITYLVQSGVIPAAERSPGPGTGNASHEAAAPDNGTAYESGSPTVVSAARSTPTTSQASYGHYSWTRYVLDQEYCGAFSGDLPAEEYFKYNVQGLGDIPEMGAGTVDLDPGAFQPDDAEEWLEGFSDHLPGLETDYTSPTLAFAPSGDGKRASRVCIRATRKIAWNPDNSDGLLTVDICNKTLMGGEILARAQALTNETAVVLQDNDGKKIVYALGGLDSSRVLYTWLPSSGIWCRIVGGRNVPPEDMVSVMNWLLSEPALLDGIHMGLTTGIDIGISPKVLAYIPDYTTNDYVPPVASYEVDWADDGGQAETLAGVDVEYEEGHEGRPLRSYTLDVYSKDEVGEDGGMEGLGPLPELNRERIESDYEFRRRLSTDWVKDNKPFSYTLYFTWDEYYVSAAFNEEATPDQIWGFVQTLKNLDRDRKLQGNADASFSTYVEAYS